MQQKQHTRKNVQASAAEERKLPINKEPCKDDTSRRIHS
jgi:hypothetical protein